MAIVYAIDIQVKFVSKKEDAKVGPELPFSVFRQWPYYHIMKGG